MIKEGSFNKIKFKIQTFGSLYLITANVKGNNVCITTDNKILYENIGNDVTISKQRFARKEIYRLIKNNVNENKRKR